MKKSIVLFLSLCLFVGGLQAMYRGAPTAGNEKIGNLIEEIKEASEEIENAKKKIESASTEIKETIDLQKKEVEDLEKITQFLNKDIDKNSVYGEFVIFEDKGPLIARLQVKRKEERRDFYLRRFIFDKKNGVIRAAYFTKDAKISRKLVEKQDTGRDYLLQSFAKDSLLDLWGPKEGETPKLLLRAFKREKLKIKYDLKARFDR